MVNKGIERGVMYGARSPEKVEVIYEWWNQNSLECKTCEMWPSIISVGFLTGIWAVLILLSYGHAVPPEQGRRGMGVSLPFMRWVV